MKDPNSALRWRLFDLRLTSMVLHAKFDLGCLGQQARMDLQIEPSEEAAVAFCDEMAGLAYQIDQTDDAIRYAEAVLWRSTTPLHEQLTVLFPASEPKDVAVAAISNVIAERRLHEFSYDCTFNPEGIARTELAARLGHAEDLMFSALHRLTDDDVQSILASNQDTDLDGSCFPVTTLKDVRNRTSVHA